MFCLKCSQRPEEGVISPKTGVVEEGGSRRCSELKCSGRHCLVSGQWWCTPLIPALGSQRQVDLCEFEASLVYSS